jgi:hypothetical protein
MVSNTVIDYRILIGKEHYNDTLFLLLRAYIYQF